MIRHMNDGTGKTIEEKRVDMELLRVAEAERKERRHRLIGVRYRKTVSENKKRAGRRFFS